MEIIQPASLSKSSVHKELNKEINEADLFDIDLDIKMTTKEASRQQVSQGRACSATCASCQYTCGNCASHQRVC